MVRVYVSLILVCCLDYSEQQGHYRKDRIPKIMGDRIPLKILLPERLRTKHKIVTIHNLFRTKVKPEASNMLKMTWNNQVAEAAQKWTKHCQFLTHDDNSGRFIPHYGPCGQNIFVATQKVPWQVYLSFSFYNRLTTLKKLKVLMLFAIRTWFLEKDNFTYGGENNLKNIGHYTQMVWAATHQVGCGISKCISKVNGTSIKYYSYICNYCPIGNLPDKLSIPYEKGKPCKGCQTQCHAKKLCTNACLAADYWSNCEELYKRWHKWLCHTNTRKGNLRRKSCRATCTCRNQIHD